MLITSCVHVLVTVVSESIHKLNLGLKERLGQNFQQWMMVQSHLEVLNLGRSG